MYLGIQRWPSFKASILPSGPATGATLTNGSAQFAPLNGYQYVLVNGMPATAPDAIWIKGDQYCPTMTNASKAYYQSTEFLDLQPQLQSFYDNFTPLLQGIFPQSEIGYQSAYGIFDYLNVGYIHNNTIYANLSSDDLFQLRTLADSQELGLVYNVSSPNVSIGGKTLSAAILSQLNKTVSGTDTNLKITYFAASYSVFQAFFGLSGLLEASADFYGLPDYASTMSFELRRPVNSSDFYVRYGFRNGSSQNAELITYPLWGARPIDADIPWADFVESMEKQSVSTQGDWCNLCMSNLTFCAAYGDSGATQTIANSNVGLSGLSLVGAGAIGAGVTIAVLMAIEGVAFAAWFLYRRTRATRRAVDKAKLSETASEASLVF
jgi:prostatic aicd phosphatase